MSIKYDEENGKDVYVIAQLQVQDCWRPMICKLIRKLTVRVSSSLSDQKLCQFQNSEDSDVKLENLHETNTIEPN